MNIIFAFFSGMFSFLSPCSVALTPILLSGFIGGKKGRSMKISRAAGIITGFSATFAVLSFAILGFASTFDSISREIEIFGGFLLVVAGVFSLYNIRIPFKILPEFTPRLKKSTSISTEFVNGATLGTLVGSFWTPCQGPFIGIISLMAAGSTSSFTIYTLIFSYVVGLITPLLIIGTFIAMKNESILSGGKMRMVQTFSHYFLIIIGFLFIVGGFGYIVEYTEKFLYATNIIAPFESIQEFSGSIAGEIKIDFGNLFSKR